MKPPKKINTERINKNVLGTDQKSGNLTKITAEMIKEKRVPKSRFVIKKGAQKSITLAP